MINTRIKLLDNRLANQIAAGEVVERPASVVKELMENSIDGDASRIEVNIERGGTRLIQVTDNGKGIHKDDLPLALTRHATSKLRSSEDLVAVKSLGFRGEALASISAVSKLTLTSRTHDSEFAWQAIAQGRDMAVEIQPAAATTGTRIEVADLFFNTPARQKFLRTEKTEFSHIEEVFKCHALANFTTAFVLKHNHKVVKRVPSCGEQSQYLKRVATICGKGFADNSVAFECRHELIHLSGWVGTPDYHRSESDIQYVFVNNRPVKDKMLNHAIRQSYEGLLPPGRMATYVIFLNVDPTQVDVNVHPTKHEVRFSEQRLIHDLLSRSISEALSECNPIQSTVPLPLKTVGSNDAIPNVPADSQPGDSSDINPTSNRVSFPRANYYSPGRDTRHGVREGHQPVHRPAGAGLANTKQYLQEPGEGKSFQSHNPGHYNASQQKPGFQSARVSDTTLIRTESSKSESDILSVGENFWIVRLDNQTIVINAQLLLEQFLQSLLKEEKSSVSQPLLFPYKLTLSPECLEDYQTHQTLARLGFVCEPLEDDRVLVKKVPIWLADKENDWIFEQLPGWLENPDGAKLSLPHAISQSFTLISPTLAGFLLHQLKHEVFNGPGYRELNSELVKGLFD